MDIKPYERSIRELLSAQKQYEIPRFQREYSWDKRHYNEFLVDMLGALVLKGGEPTSSAYFMGTMLFVGDAEDKEHKPLQVVDGQQRLTTITILFAVLYRFFLAAGEDKLADNVFRYIMAEDDNGKEVRVLKTVSSYPYFSFFIQSREIGDADNPTTEEEKGIEETYQFFERQLQEGNLRSVLKKINPEVSAFSYVDILKALRDQVLNSTIIGIYTSEGKVANKLFEILNAKGKHLTFIDLIKNKIFEYLDDVEPADFASETWSAITDIINTGEERTGFATFFRHYWSSKYKRSTSSAIYKDFTRLVHKEDYKDFLKQLKNEATVYQLVSNPTREAFSNRKEYYYLVQSLKSFNTFFNVIQIRVPLLALFDVKSKGLINRGKLEEVVKYLEGFHFAYNAVLSKSPNRVEPVYSRFAIALRDCEDVSTVNDIVQKLLYAPLDELFPKFDEFSKGFIKLSYSKKDNPSNLKTKYALFKLNSFYQGTPLFDEKGSVEHIISEAGDVTTNIGNLILLEIDLNNEAADSLYDTKKKVYNKSNYTWVKQFVVDYPTWSEKQIEKRAEKMALCYYEKVLNRKK